MRTQKSSKFLKESNELYDQIFKDFVDQMKDSYTLIGREYGTEYKLSQEQLDEIVENHTNFYDVVTEIYEDNAFWEVENESIDYYIDEIFKTLRKKYPDVDFDEFKEDYYEQIREKFLDKSDDSLYKYFLEDGQYPAYMEWVSNYEAMAKPVNYDEDGQGFVFLDEYLNELMEQLGINPKEFADYAKSKGYEIEKEEDWKDKARNPKMLMNDFFAMIIEDEGFYWDGSAQFVMLGYVNLKDMLDSEGYFNPNGKYIVPNGAECSMINLFTGYGDYELYPLAKNLEISLDQKGSSYWRLSMDTNSVDRIYGYTPEHEIEDGGVYSNLLLKKANVVESKKNFKENKKENKMKRKQIFQENKTIKEEISQIPFCVSATAKRIFWSNRNDIKNMSKEDILDLISDKFNSYNEDSEEISNFLDYYKVKWDNDSFEKAYDQFEDDVYNFIKQRLIKESRNIKRRKFLKESTLGYTPQKMKEALESFLKTKVEYV